MCLGKMVELANSNDLFSNALHHYTQALLSAIPVADLDRKKDRIILEWDVPNPINPPSGCPFHPRCPKAKGKCSKEIPLLENYHLKEEQHLAACHFVEN